MLISTTGLIFLVSLICSGSPALDTLAIQEALHRVFRPIIPLNIAPSLFHLIHWRFSPLSVFFSEDLLLDYLLQTLFDNPNFT